MRKLSKRLLPPDDLPAELVPPDDIEAIMAVWEGEVRGFYYTSDDETWAQSEALAAWRTARAKLLDAALAATAHRRVDVSSTAVQAPQ